jgi:hypothetical protein
MMIASQISDLCQNSFSQLNSAETLVFEYLLHTAKPNDRNKYQRMRPSPISFASVCYLFAITGCIFTITADAFVTNHNHGRTNLLQINDKNARPNISRQHGYPSLSWPQKRNFHDKNTRDSASSLSVLKTLPTQWTSAITAMHGDNTYVLTAILWLSTFGISLEKRTTIGKALSVRAYNIATITFLVKEVCTDYILTTLVDPLLLCSRRHWQPWHWPLPLPI